MHPETAQKLTRWLELVRDEGEDRALDKVKGELRASK